MQSVRSILILGAGSAALLAALSLRQRMPQIPIRLVFSREIGVIGVGEGSTVDLPRHLHGFLGLDPARFFADVDPTIKLGVHFLWGPSPAFDYTFTTPLTSPQPGLSRLPGFYAWDDFSALDTNSALMAAGRTFARDLQGRPVVEPNFGYHVENATFVAYLEKCAAANGVEMIEGRVTEVETGEQGVTALRLEDGRQLQADLYLDASGFRSELLGRALQEPFHPFTDALFCDRALAGGWERTDEPLLPYTTAETMEAGWSWQIEHRRHVHRGYVYSSQFISDTEAEAEFRRRNPRLGPVRVVPFRVGRYERCWVKNVVAIGNSAGFVEPLEATALLLVCQEARLLAQTLAEGDGGYTPSGRESLNRVMSRFWDETRDFLAIHYRFNSRLQTPFWEHCRRETALHGAGRIVEAYQENGPTALFEMELLNPATSLFHLEGFYTLLLGQKVPHQRLDAPTAAELAHWQLLQQHSRRQAAQAFPMAEMLPGVAALLPGKW